jgi:hypothetical protein
MFQPIQIILLAALLLSVALVLLVLKNQIVGRVFFVSQFFLGCLFVLWPDLSSRLASLLGVGRGTDLLLYFLILFVYVSSLCLVAKFRRLEKVQTEVIRAIALQQAIDNSQVRVANPEE